MNSNIETRYGSELCKGCLSVERKLTAITDAQNLKLYCDLIEENQITQPLLLCWECRANVHRLVTFKQQVKVANNTLFNCLMQQSMDSKPLTKLSVVKLDPLNINIENPLMDTEEITPMTFVKLESPQNAEDFLLNVTPLESGGSMDLESVRTDPFLTKEDFSSNDDEPLINNKKKVTKKRKMKQTQKRKLFKDKRDKDTNELRHSQAKRYRMQSINTLKRLNMADNEYLQLVVLTWEEVEEERQKSLASDSFKKMLYRCHDCVLGFNHRFKLDNHMKKHEPEYGPEVCDICKIRCKHASALAAHKKRHQVKWRCGACGGAWSRASVAADHVSRAHRAASPTHHCSLCTLHFPTLNKLRLHMKQHSERVKCDLCDKTFVDRSAMRNHLFIHVGKKEFSCSQCGKRFLFKRAMELHRATHAPAAAIYCHTCDLSFKNEMSYRQHMLYSLKHVDPARLKYACDVCDKRFVKAKRLEEHHIAVHLKATPVNCTEPGCNFACSSRPVLRTHTRMLHRNARARRDHVCHLCGKAYTSKAALQGHLRAHSGERPLRCARCPAAFGYPAALYNHNRLVHLAQPSGKNKTNGVSQTVTAATVATLAPVEQGVRPTWPALTPSVDTQANETLPN